jgi:CO/xanthine dehydrogenase FAD-binding subunit
VRAYLPAYELRAPGTLADALALLSSQQGVWRPFAGGTDLMVLLEAGKLPEGRYLGLWRLQELIGIDETETDVVIGALTTYTDILNHPVLQSYFPLLGRAAADVGGVATQNRGTIGGNIANASPAADMPPALLVYDAELDLVSAQGARRVPYDRFHLGYRQMDMRPDELIKSLRLPKRGGQWSQYYRKVGTRRAQAISKVCLAATWRLANGLVQEIRIAMNSVAPTVIRARSAEGALMGKSLQPASLREAQAALATDIKPIDDIRSSARYRLRVAQQLLAECLEGA